MGKMQKLRNNTGTVLKGMGTLLLAAGLSLSTAGMFHAVTVQEYMLQDYDEESYVGSGHWQELRLSGKEAAQYPALNQALDTWFSEEGMRQESTFHDYCQEIREIRTFGASPDVSASLEYDVYPRRSDEKVFSFLASFYGYSGGVHGYYSYSGRNFDPSTGKELQLADVITDEGLLRTILEFALTEKYPDSSFASNGGSLEGYGFDPEDDQYTWLMDPQGIVFYFNPYEIASYAEGCLFVELSYAQHPGLFRNDYCMDGSFACAQPYWWQGVSMDLDGDGSFEKISIIPNYTDYSRIESIRIDIDSRTYQGSTLVGDMWCYDILPVLMHLRDGNNYLYIDTTSDNDWHNLFVVDLNGPQPRLVTTVTGAGLYKVYGSEADAFFRPMPLDPERFLLSSRFDLLSTYCAQRCYKAGEYGPIPLEKYYTVPSAHPLLTVRDLPVEELDEATGEMTGGRLVVPAGEMLMITRTDGDSFVDVRRGDGSTVRILIDTNVWPRTIEGEDEKSFFETLYYAG